MLNIILSTIITLTATFTQAAGNDITNRKPDETQAVINTTELRSLISQVDQILQDKRQDKEALLRSLPYATSEQKQALMKNLKILNQNISDLQNIKSDLEKTIQIVEE